MLGATSSEGRQKGREGIHTVPVGNVLVGDAGGNIEHDDTALAVNVVTITETTELLLAGGIPNIELDLTEVLRGTHPLVADREGRATAVRG